MAEAKPLNVQDSALWIAVVACLLVPATALAGEDPEEVDPDLAVAIEEDRTAREGKRSQRPAASSARMNPAISLILDSSVGWYTREIHIQQGGHAPDANGFTLQGLELAASASVDPFFRIDVNFELAHVHIEEAYLTTLALPANLQARAGFFNAAFGRQNPQHLHSWKFVNPPLSHTRFMAEEHFAGLGAELSFLAPLPWYLLILVEVFDTSTVTRLRSSTFGGVDRTETGKLDGPEDFVYVARLENFFELSADWSLQVGLNGAWGQSPYVPDNRATLYGTDIYIKWRPISAGKGFRALALTLEYLLRDTQVPDDSVRDHGGYAQLDFQWSRQWMAGLRLENTDRLHGRPPDPDMLGEWHWRTSVVLTFMPTHFSKVRLQYDLGAERAGQPGLDSPAHAFFLQVEVSAGEHGAHRF